MASDLIGAVFILILFSAFILVGIGSTSILSNNALGSCTQNGTSWSNCSLSDDQANAIYQARETSGAQYAILTPFQWIILLAVIISALLFLGGNRRK